MSTNINSIFEYVNQKTGKWETANLYKKYSDGAFNIAQLITGNSEYWAAISGDDPFDFPINDEGEVLDNLVDPLERIEEIIIDSSSGNVPSNASSDTKEYYEQFGMSGWGADTDRKQYPQCVTYTLRDLDLLEMLAKGASAKALRFYTKYFAQIRWLLYSVQRSEYISKGSDVRVVIWAS
ncbi:MAG: hypothetical protein PHX74_10705 [Candidatus Sumerlaeales bacterium]|nr:hypothetical protein [Candidatus Sumerlaeales bacterium]